tara:strand:+ start:39 stop:395 length:357 start_codon:yes stop_codon:yes gene_type:complete
MGYKMKGFSGFKPSPAKVSDKAVVEAQDRLDHVELDYKTPGWAKAAGEIFTPPGQKKGKSKKGGGGGGGGDPEKKTKKGAAAGPQGKDFQISDPPERKIGPQGNEGDLASGFGEGWGK